MRYLLGIDVGTTGTKTLLFRQDGRLMGHAYCPYDTQTPEVGWSEQNPNDWWNAVVQTVRQVCADPAVAQKVAGAFCIKSNTVASSVTSKLYQSVATLAFSKSVA